MGLQVGGTTCRLHATDSRRFLSPLGLSRNFRKLSSHSVIRNGQLLCGGPPEPTPVPTPAPPTPRVRTLQPTTPIPTTAPEPTHTPTTRESPSHSQKCGGTFVGLDGNT